MNSENSKKGDLFFQYYCVIFIDLLGQRERLRKITQIPISETEKQPFIDTIKQSVGKVLQIRGLFQTYFDTGISYEPNVERIPPEFHDEFRASQREKLHYNTFSDSLTISVPLMPNSDESCAAVNGIFCALIAAAGIGISALLMDTPLRAGLNVGVATLIDNNEIYGPALEGAVYLESRLAEYPRFLVGDQFWRYLVAIEQQVPLRRMGQYAKEMAALCQKMIVLDTDGRLMVDFLGETIRHLPENPITKEDIVQARDFVISQYNQYAEAENHKLASRYFRLMRYFKSREAAWGIASAW